MKEVRYWLATAVVILGLGLGAASAHAETWETVTSGVTNDLNSVYQVDENTAYAVGGAPFIGGPGVVLKTTNGGTSWVSQTLPLPSGATSIPPLHGISCPSATTCYAVGDSSYIIKTTNGGSTWTLQTVSGGPWFWDVYMTSETSGVAVGNVGAIYRTTNGTTWSSVPSGTDTNLLALHFSSPTTGWAVGNGSYVFKTTDSGATWSRLSGIVNSGGSSGIFWRDSTHGWVASDGGEVKRTSDGGATWTAGHFDVSLGFKGIFFKDTGTGFGVANSGVIRKSTDDGATWSNEISGTGAILRGVQCVGTRCLIVGDDGVILRAAVTSGSTSGSTGTTGSGSAGNTTPGSGSPATTQSDSTAPSVPTGLTNRTGTPDDQTPTFSWNGSTDNVGVISYDIRILDRTSSNVARTGMFAESQSHIYTVPDLLPLEANKPYSFQVRARDAAGNVSDYANLDFQITAAVVATPATQPATTPTPTGDTQAPTAPTGLSLTTPPSVQPPSFIWNSATDNIGVTGYDVHIIHAADNVQVMPATGFLSLPGPATNYTAPALLNFSLGEKYYIEVRAKDAAGNVSTPTALSFIIGKTAGDTSGKPVVTTPTTATSPTPTPTSVTPTAIATPATAATIPADKKSDKDSAAKNTSNTKDEPSAGTTEPTEAVGTETASDESLPDLTPEIMILTRSRLKFKITNTGADLTSGFKVKLQWLRQNGTRLSTQKIIEFGALLGNNTYEQWDSNTASRPANVRAFISQPPSGAYTLRVTVDYDDQHEESDETNNRAQMRRPLAVVKKVK